jgi:hypothetical protein
MSPQMETRSLQQQAREELYGELCACGQKKKSAQSFCRRCYFVLPPATRSALYKSFSDGYVEVYDEAKEFLKAEGRIQK